MSITATALAPCSKCGEKSEITVYKSINVSENPELKEKIRNGSLFLWKCPHCGQANLARYESLYHDPEKKIMIWLMPSGDLPESQMQAIANHTKALNRLDTDDRLFCRGEHLQRAQEHVRVLGAADVLDQRAEAARKGHLDLTVELVGSH